MLTCLGEWSALAEGSTVDLHTPGKELVRCSWWVVGNSSRGCLGPGVSMNVRRWEVERPTTRVRIAQVRIPT